MENIDKTIYGVIGGFTVGVIQYLIVSFMRKKNTLEAEKLDKISSTVDRLEKLINTLLSKDQVNIEKWSVSNNRMKDLEEDLKCLNEKIAQIDIRIAKLK